MPTILAMHEACALHDTGWGHPEHQGRLPAILHALHADTPMLLDHVIQVEAHPATVDDALLVHTREHVEIFRVAAERAIASNGIVALDGETLVSPATWDAAFGAAGAAITATRGVIDGVAPTAFALCRPPGHHATESRAMGFCILNNAAIAARAARRAGLDRILIIDLDVHHGNGTQDIFYDDASVFYMSLHQHPLYPGSGFSDERGEGAGRGTTLNVQIEQGTEGPEYHTALNHALMVGRGFEPDLVILSAGFDCLRGDPLGGLALEPSDLHTAATMIMEAIPSAQGRMVGILEGGYNPKRTGQGVVDVMRAMAGLPAL